jgi:hypothetical protein
MEYFVKKGSIMRTIMGKSDTVLFVFAGSAAEFALNKAVDWLYFTGNLPKDPLGRLFSTVGYARMIVFSEMEAANKAIDKITAIHAAVENKRGASIPQWAYRDVLFMLIDYSIRSFELLERKLTTGELNEVYNVFYRVGKRMNISNLPENYNEWLGARETHLANDLMKSDFTVDLYRQYKTHLGRCRYWLLIQGQKMLVPGIVKYQLEFNDTYYFKPLLKIYKLSRLIKLDGFVKLIILPSKYQKEIAAIDFIE